MPLPRRASLEITRVFGGSFETSHLRKFSPRHPPTRSKPNDADRWFSVTMGTGIVSILLHNLPYNAIWLFWISVVLFVLNIALFVAFTCVSILRYTMYPEIWGAMIRHPTQSLFLGTFPMGFATIINMVVFVCVPSWGEWVITVAWAMWWIDAAISVATCFYLPFVMSVFVF